MPVIYENTTLGWDVLPAPHDDQPVPGLVIGKGGESIADNTYGIEIEFCTHDSVVFQFTHVEAASFHFDAGEPWKLESDSDNIFELVSPPLTFDTLAHAYDFKALLVAALLKSIREAMTSGINAIPFARWAAGFGNILLGLIRSQIQAGLLRMSLPTTGQTHWSTWQAVGNELVVANVDDGINIPAARLLHLQHQDDWAAYTQRIILARCSKFWSEGYSSQMNLPMSLNGYFLYMLRKTHDRVYSARIVAREKLVDTRDNRKLNAWYWRHVVLRAWCAYVITLGATPGADHLLRGGHLAKSALLYLVAGKVLTGAMAELGEEPQMAMQVAAWNASSTSAIEADDPKVANKAWAPYHSALKDLTGLWLKASLLDVMRTQDAETYRWAVEDLPAALMRTDVWDFALMEWDILDRLAPLRSKLDWDDLDDFSVRAFRAVLCSKAQAVAVGLAHALRQLDPLVQGPPDLPAPDERPFLQRAGVPMWEARYDTLYPPIIVPGQPTRYLVEHRNN